MTNRRDFLIKFTMAAGAVTVFRPMLSFARIQQASVLNDTLCLLHTADLNGQALALSNGFRGLGGSTAMQYTLQSVKKESSPMLLLHVGNVATVATQSREECVRLYKTLRHAGYDAVVPGESDLAKGHSYFQAMADEADLPLLNGSAAGLLPNRVLQKGRFTVGLINASSIHNSRPALQAAIVNKTAASLKASGCNVVVCLAHKMSASNKYLLAKASAGVDVIMGCAEKLSVHNAEIVCNSRSAEVVLSRAGANGTTVSCVELTFGSNSERTAFAARNLFVGAENESLSALMQKYRLSYT